MSHIVHTPPNIDYLAKDYASFRRLMMDHLSQLVPNWQEQTSADLGQVLVEVLAYAADYLSYYQDAVATEAYLGTARLRRSIRRHLRPLEYYLEEGCNSRAWVQIQVKEQENDPIYLPVHTRLVTQLPNCNTPFIQNDEAVYRQALLDGLPVFETMHPISLNPRHNRIPILPKGENANYLSRGATSTHLDYQLDPNKSSANLRVGDVLLIKEQFNPQTGDNHPDHCHAVRLTRVTPVSSGVDIEWAVEDALPFDVCFSRYRTIDPDFYPGVALGNIVLADHGRTIIEKELPPVQPGERYRPRLRFPDLTFAAPFYANTSRKQPALQAFQYEAYEAFACVQLFQYAAQSAQRTKNSREPHLLEKPDGEQDGYQEETMLMRYRWTLRRDLLNSDPFDRDFQVEMQEDRQAYLRFGFGGMGKLPVPGERFEAKYRVGNGSRGNVGAETIAHLVLGVKAEEFPKDRIKSVCNPLPARGGCDPETIESARLHAPYAYQIQKACVTAEDYARCAMQHREVKGARAHTQYIGGRPTVLICVQRAGGEPVDDAFEQKLRNFIEPTRLMGHVIAIEGPRFVGARIVLRVALEPTASAGAVRERLDEAFSTRINPDGQPGLFHPDHFNFGQSLHQSPIIARAMQVPGVRWVDMEQFGRAGSSQKDLEIRTGPDEILRLDNIDYVFEDNA